MDETFEPQQIANRVNLGAHQHLIEAEDEDGRTGRWIVRRPTMRDELKIAVEYARLKTPANSPNPVEIDASYDTMAFMVSTLNAVIDMRPDWFPKDAGDCYDALLIGELFEEYQTWKDSFRRQLPAAQDGDSGASEPA